MFYRVHLNIHVAIDNKYTRAANGNRPQAYVHLEKRTEPEGLVYRHENYEHKDEIRRICAQRGYTLLRKVAIRFCAKWLYLLRKLAIFSSNVRKLSPPFYSP
jgi:hypothetical protein